MANVFWSGHSLTDPPIPEFVANISRSLGISADWNRHSMGGGSMFDRTRGRPPQEGGWAGYRQGNNRASINMDVIEELTDPKTIAGNRYDFLVITEVHGILWPLLRRDTVRLLRHYHERFIDGNPAGQTFLYQAWLSLADKNDPTSWIQYERAAAPLWRCIATRLNTSLEFEGRKDRIGFIPVGLALAELVDDKSEEPALNGISLDPHQTVTGLVFSDDVHVTRVGSYFVALVTFAFIHDRSPIGAWHPPDINPDDAALFQRFAADFMRNYRDDDSPLELSECSKYVREKFAHEYWRYEIGRQPHNSESWWQLLLESSRRNIRRLRNTYTWQRSFAADAPDNPFRFDPATDEFYWHPAP